MAVNDEALLLLIASARGVGQQKAAAVRAVGHPSGREEAPLPNARGGEEFERERLAEREDCEDRLDGSVGLHAYDGVARLYEPRSQKGARRGDEVGVRRDELVLQRETYDFVYVVLALAVQVHLAQDSVNARARPDARQVRVRVVELRQANVARESDGLGPVCARHLHGGLRLRAFVASDEREAGAVRPVLVGRVHLVEVRGVGRLEPQALDVRRADLLEEEFQRERDVFCLARFGEVAVRRA